MRSARCSDLADLPEYQIIRSKRQSLQITIVKAKVVVRAPVHLSERSIVDFVRQKASWILQKLAQQQQKVSEQYVVEHDAAFSWLGRPVTLKFERATKPGVIERDTQLVIQSRSPEPARCEKILFQWIKQEAQAFMVPQTHELTHQMGLANRLTEVRFRRTHRKWGHCSSQGVIQYNWLIMLAPMEVVDYLIAHEASHLEYMNHSKDFWKLVESVCPDYKRIRRWLRDNEHRLAL